MELIIKASKHLFEKRSPRNFSAITFLILGKFSHFVTKKECCQCAAERHSIRCRKYLRLLSTPATRQVTLVFPRLLSTVEVETQIENEERSQTGRKEEKHSTKNRRIWKR